jgi:hypothetical protein
MSIFLFFILLDLTKTFIAIGSAIILAIISLWKAYLEGYIKKFFSKNEIKDLKDLHEREEFQQLFETSNIIKSLKIIVKETVAKRAMILVAHNGGGPIGFEYLTKTTCLFSEGDNNYFEGSSMDYIDTPIDDDYWNTLLSTIKKKEIIIHTKELEDNLLKSIYSKNNVKSSKIIYLSHTYTEEYGIKKVSNIYYMLLATPFENIDFKESTTESILLINIGKIKNYYQKYFNNALK